MDGTTPTGGAPQAPATTPAAPSPATTSHAQDSESAMLAAVQRGRGKAPAARTATSPPARTPGERTPDDADAASASRPEPEDGKSPVGESEKQQKKQPDAIPFAKFQERLNREREKVTGLETKLSEQGRSIASYERAMDLLKAELQAEREARQAGQPFDEREAQLREYQLADKARAARQELDTQHATETAQAAEQARMGELRDTLGEQLSAALSQYEGVVHREEVLEAWEANPTADADAIAKHLYEQKLEKVQARLPKTAAQPPTPQTARSGPRGSAPVFSDNDDGIGAWLKAARGQ